MPESGDTHRDLLRRIARGTVQSVPVLGAYVEQVIFGTLDDKANREKRAELRTLFDSLAEGQQESHDATIGEILGAARRQAAANDDLAAKLDRVLAVIDRPVPSARDRETAPRTVVPSVFISSTIDDLEPYRDAARSAANRAEFVPLLSDYSVESQHKPTLDL